MERREMRQIVVACLVVVAALSVFGVADAQDLASVGEQESEMSRILKSSGSLLLRESHYLPDVETRAANDIECRVLVVKNLLSLGGNSVGVAVGLVLTIEEKYSEQTAYIDPDEVDGLIASIEFIERDGAAVLSAPITSNPAETGVSSEIHFTTKDGTVLAVFLSSGQLVYGIKVTRSADWALLSEAGRRTLLANLKAAKEIVDSV